MSKNKLNELPTQQYLLECFDCDFNLGILVWKKRPLHHFDNEHDMNVVNAKFVGKVAGKVNNQGYIRCTLDYIIYNTHRIIWKLYYGTDPKETIDHINGIKDDNRIENLREATYSQNTMNKNRLIKSNSSGYFGISYYKKSNVYRASVSYSYENIYIGEFKDINEARTRRVLLEKALYKEFYAKTDDIEDTDYYKNYIDNLTEEQLVEYTTIPDKIRRKSKNNVTGFVGVTVTPSGRYMGSIQINKKRHITKTYDTAEEAYNARLELKELKSLNTTET